MKVLHINTAQDGGAAWCAIRIFKALKQEGVDSRMLFAEGETLPAGIEGAIATRDQIVWNDIRILQIFKNLMARLGWWILDVEKMKARLNKANRKRLFLHQPLSYYRNIAQHPLVKWADIIHLHWVPDLIDYPTFFKEVKKPIVWTLHDKYPAMGTQHYCSEFLPVPVELQEIDSQCRRIKRNGVLKAQDLNIVAISEMMIDICKCSDVLKGFPVTLIHNGVNTTTFRPYDKLNVRKEMGLPPDAKVFLFSAFRIDDENKGLGRIIDALERVDLPDKLLVCIGGFSNKPIPEASFPVILTGILTNQAKIAQYYSASDFFLQCSYEETFAQTPLEAMSCGTPVISTPCCGAKDIVHPFNGVICDGYDADSIAAGISNAIKKHYDGNEIRQYIIDNYQYDKIAKQYAELYNRILDETAN